MDAAVNTTPTPAPTPAHHFNLTLLLRVLLALAPAVAAPFVKNPNSQAILQAEIPVLSELAAALGQSQEQ